MEDEEGAQGVAKSCSKSCKRAGSIQGCVGQAILEVDPMSNRIRPHPAGHRRAEQQGP